MQSKRINRNFTYSPKLKLQAVKRYLNGQSCSSICEQLKIQDPKRIYVWAKAYQDKGELAFIDQRGKQATGRPKTKFMSLEEEVEYLRAQNLLLKKSIERKRGC
ncbi:helix-turn-helix domain-containing protein [Turicibacter bilis]|uniref:helix-turn-helix domain-containing protein n=1 Tax=Turicibacter bilis TaxID=2735723 RepID=UPI0031BB61AD